MIAHTTLAVGNYRKSKSFYVNVLRALGYRNNMEQGRSAGFTDGRNTDFWGGKDHGAPGYRDYSPGYFAAFVLDPDGHNIEAVWYDPRRQEPRKKTARKKTAR